MFSNVWRCMNTQCPTAAKINSYARHWVACCTLLIPSIACADTFQLKDGTRLEGMAEEDGEYLVIKTFNGMVRRVKRSEVGWIKKPEHVEYYEKLKATPADDVAAQYALGVWAQEKQMERQAQERFRNVLKLDPFHEGAGKGLGFVRNKEGLWVDRDALPKPERSGATGTAASPARSQTDLQKQAHDLARQLQAAIKSGPQWTSMTEADEILAQAKSDPETFVRIMRAPQLKESAGIQDGEIRAQAARVLGLVGDRRALDGLMEACVTDPDDRVRYAAAKSLQQLDEPVALRRLVDEATNPRNPKLTRELLCIAIKRYGDKKAIERLLDLVAFELAGGSPIDPRNQLRAPEQGIGTENPLGMPSGPPPVNTRDTWVLYPVLAALKYVSDTDFEQELDVKTWKIWWEREREKFRFKE